METAAPEEAELLPDAARALIAALRAEGARCGDVATVDVRELAATRAAVADTTKEIDRLRVLLEHAEAAHASALRAHEALERRDREARTTQARGIALEERADDMERTIADQGAVAPTIEERGAALGALHAATSALLRAKAAADARAVADKHRAALDQARRDALVAEQLDVAVRRLTAEAPAELLARSNGIRGLTLEGDQVLLDGKRLSALSGSEQMRLCVEIAKRANKGSAGRFLVVDKLEAIDLDERAAFVREVRKGGWQLIATLVDRGDVHLVEVGDEETAEVAE